MSEGADELTPSTDGARTHGGTARPASTWAQAAKARTSSSRGHLRSWTGAGRVGRYNLAMARTSSTRSARSGQTEGRLRLPDLGTLDRPHGAVRSTAPTPARSTSRSRTAASRRSTAATSTRSRAISSARRSAASTSASTARTALLYPAVRQGDEGPGHVRARHLGRSARSDRAAACPRSRTAHGARSHPSLLLRRLERPADPEHQRRRAVAPLRHVAPGDDHLRGADRRRQPGALRQDARRRLPGLSAREADHPVGREPVGVGHPSRPLRQGSAGRRRDARRDRSADARRWRRKPTCTWRCGPAPICRSRSRCIACCSRKGTPTRRSSPRTRTAPIGCARRRRRGRSSARPREAAIDPAALRRLADLYVAVVAGARALRLGAGAQPQRRQRGGGGAGAAGRRRQVRRPRRRLLDEQLARLRPQVGAVDRRRRSRRRAS